MRIGNSILNSTKSPPQVSVIIPTYCEAENLVILIPRIVAMFEKSGLDGEIIVVDDDSPDDPESACHVEQTAFPIRVLVRKDERGLSSAVIHGMDHATGDLLLVMDADLSHPAEKIPELFAAANSNGTEFVIGSRYVKGGGTDEDWGFFRWLNSKVATWLARPLTTSRDPMAGFFAIHRNRFRKSRELLDPVGYKIGLELIVKCRCKQVKEVPIFFTDRQHGESKLSFREQLNYLRHLMRLYRFRLGRRS